MATWKANRGSGNNMTCSVERFSVRIVSNGGKVRVQLSLYQAVETQRVVSG
jgi:hypothetical protein